MMTTSQFFVGLFMEIFIWGLLLFLPPPVSTHTNFLSLLKEKWSLFKVGQKCLTLVLSFLAGAICAALGWGAFELGQAAALFSNGVAVLEPLQPFGSWQNFWQAHLSFIFIFFFWLQFWPHEHRV